MKKKTTKKSVKKSAPRKTAKPKKKSSAPKTKRTSGLNQITYSLSEELQAVVKAKKLTRPQVVKKLWVYIKDNKCQDTKNRRMIIPDKTLAAVIGNKPVDMLKLAGHLNKHIKK